MKNGAAVSSEIEIPLESPLSPAVESNKRWDSAAEILALLQRAGVDCALINPCADEDVPDDKSEAAPPH